MNFRLLLQSWLLHLPEFETAQESLCEVDGALGAQLLNVCALPSDHFHESL